MRLFQPLRFAPSVSAAPGRFPGFGSWQAGMADIHWLGGGFQFETFPAAFGCRPFLGSE